MVSLRLGQVTRATSWRTCWMNSVALVFAMPADLEGGLLSPIWRLARPVPSRKRGNSFKRWQEWRGSNPQPPVLETGALPVELHSFINSLETVQVADATEFATEAVIWG